MIRLENIHKSFGTIPALQNISLTIDKGKITVFAGADGSGKSTLFKLIIGLLHPDSGVLIFNGQMIGHDYSAITSCTGYMPERFSLYPDLSVDENLNFYADIYSVPRPVREKRKQELLARTGMIKFKSRRAGALSGGMKQKLALSTLLVAAPDIIILDEPTTGVDPLSRIEFFDIIKDLKAEGKTIVISTPYLDEAEQGDTIVMLKNGQIIKQDTIDHLKSSFPAYLYRLEAQGDIFRQLEQINQSEHIITAYARGKSIRVLSRQANLEMDHTVIGSSKKETPKLEDIYLYYEQSHD